MKIMEIIIPAYNCTSTLRRTMNSLVKQTNKCFSVLIVDDCSTEDIYLIVKEYANILSIKYIRNNVNKGVGMTRQRGVDESNADYVAFLDADDLLLPNAISDWCNEINNKAPDVIYSPFIYVQDNIWEVPNYFWLCHGKVYKRSFLEKYGIKESEEVKCCDDSFWNWQVFDLAQDISILSNPTYVQVQTNGSVTSSKNFRRNVLNDFQLAKQLAKNHISKFKDNPLLQYETINTEVKNLILREKENNEKFITRVKKELSLDILLTNTGDNIIIKEVDSPCLQSVK